MSAGTDPPAASFAGRYRFVDLLGAGGMGAVWRVWDERDQRYVAAKVLRLSRADALLRFVVEQGTRISHPHVLTPTGWSADDERVLFTMDLVDGGSVADLVGDLGPLRPDVVADLLGQLLDALQAVHAAGVVHRDVTPANLLLRATGSSRPHLLLSDFGVAVRSDLPRLTSQGELVGTPGYLAPELLRGADPHPGTDLYAVGAVAVAMITGEHPRAGEGPDRLLARLTACAAPWPLQAVVRSLLEATPGNRPAGAGEARARLSEAGAVLLDVPGAGPGDEPFTVLHHLPPLPAGWGPTGPRPGAAAGVDPVPPAAPVLPVTVPLVTVPLVTVPAVAAAPVVTAPAVTAPAVTAPVLPPPATGVPAVTGGRSDAAPGLPRWHRPALIAVSVALAAVLTAIAALALGGS